MLELEDKLKRPFGQYIPQATAKRQWYLLFPFAGDQPELLDDVESTCN